MKTHLLIFLSFALPSLLDCCICDDEPECCQPSKVTVEMAVRVQDADVVTRTTDESTIADINLFLRGPEGSQHLYSTAPTLRFACIPVYTRFTSLPTPMRICTTSLRPISTRTRSITVPTTTIFR